MGEAAELERRLDEVVEQLNLAYAAEADASPGVVVDYLLIYAAKRYDTDGRSETAYGMSWPSDGRTAHYAGLGLVEYAKAKITRNLLDEDTFEGD